MNANCVWCNRPGFAALEIAASIKATPLKISGAPRPRVSARHRVALFLGRIEARTLGAGPLRFVVRSLAPMIDKRSQHELRRLARESTFHKTPRFSTASVGSIEHPPG